jgi:hypothetical protein
LPSKPAAMIRAGKEDKALVVEILTRSFSDNKTAN